MERTHVVTEKGINTIMAAKKYRELFKEANDKSAAIFDEGKLVSSCKLTTLTLLNKK